MHEAADVPSLLLFVRGQGARSMDAIRTVKRACSTAYGNRLPLTVIDVFNAPELAERHRVVATPTLLWLDGATERRLVGAISEQNVRAQFESERDGA